MGFQANLAFGKLGESHIANWFKRLGYCALPVYEKQINEGKGPQLFTPSGSLVAPDILVFKKDVPAAKVWWIEAKHKSAFTWYRKYKRWTTGIDKRHYEQYLKVAEVSPWPVWLLFLHGSGIAKDTPAGMASPTGLFGGELGYLSRNVDHRSPNWAKGMVYWSHEILRQLATLEEVLGRLS